MSLLNKVFGREYEIEEHMVCVAERNSLSSARCVSAVTNWTN